MDELAREELISIILELRDRVASLERENAELRARLGMGGGCVSSTPEWAKPNRAERRAAERAERKKRKQSFGRKLDIPTRQVEHAVEKCPDCGRKLVGGWIASKRQTIEIPQAPVEIVEHVLIARRCGVCGKVHIPKLTIADGVVGKCRVGPRLMSLIGTLAIAKRMPLRSIQKLVVGLYGLSISLGEITQILHRLAGFARQSVQHILRRVRGSPHAHADETGWREDGINGYLWSFSTAECRYFHFDRSRAGAVARQVLGLCFCGVLVCDFYSGYSWYDGPIQRCWVHFLRDLGKLLEAHPENASVREWAESVRAIYKLAKKVAGRKLSERLRIKFRRELEDRLIRVAKPYLKNESAPQRVLAERIEKHLAELFTFVEYPGCPSANNPAERAIRPAVIARKVSGGTRSEAGSRTRTALMTVFGTWALQGKDLLAACQDMITQAQMPAHIPAQ